MALKLPGSKLLAVALIVSFGGSFHFGYQLVITNPSQAAFLSFLNQSYFQHYGKVKEQNFMQAVWSAIVAILFVGAIFGSLTLRTVGEKIGRKRGLYLSLTLGVLAVLASIISFFVTSFELYAASRIILGYSLSLSLGLSALYLAESSPKQCRGFVSMMTGTTVQLGTVVGSVLAMPSILGTTQLWWYMYLLELIMFILVLSTLPFMPESPGYLVLRNDEDAAKRSIKFFHNCKTEELDDILVEIRNNIRENAKSMSLFSVWRHHEVTRGVIVGMVVAFAMAFSGVAVINAFAVEIFQSTGLSIQAASIGNTILAIVSLIAVIFSSFIIDKFGRRLLLLTTNACIIIINLLIFALMYSFEKYKYSWIGFSLIGVISIFIVFFAIGPGPLVYFVATEMVGQESRAAAQSWASLTQMSCRALLLAIYLPISNLLGHSVSYVILFIVPVIASLIYLFYNMPETKNKSINEVLLAMKNLPRTSSLWKCFRNGKKVLRISTIEGTSSSYVFDNFHK